MTARGLRSVLALIRSRLAGADVPVRVGIDAAGHYPRPCWRRPCGLQAGRYWNSILRLCRAAQGATTAAGLADAVDLEAITALVLAGRGIPVTAGVCESLSACR